MTYSEIYEKAYCKKLDKCCPDCEGSGTLYFADDEVMVCSSCGYSIEAEDVLPAWVHKFEEACDFTY